MVICEMGMIIKKIMKYLLGSVCFFWVMMAMAIDSTSLPDAHLPVSKIYRNQPYILFSVVGVPFSWQMSGCGGWFGSNGKHYISGGSGWIVSTCDPNFVANYVISLTSVERTAEAQDAIDWNSIVGHDSTGWYVDGWIHVHLPNEPSYQDWCYTGTVAVTVICTPSPQT